MLLLEKFNHATQHILELRKKKGTQGFLEQSDGHGNKVSVCSNPCAIIIYSINYKKKKSGDTGI